MRFLSGRAITLSHTFYDEEDSIAGIPSVSVTVWPKGSTTSAYAGAATENTDDHCWSVATGVMLPTGCYTVQWASTNYTDTDEFEVVGNYLFTVADVRNADPDLVATRFPASKVTAYREQVEHEFQRITWRSFTKRTARVSVTHDDPDWRYIWQAPTFDVGLYDARAVTGVTVNGTAADATLWSVTTEGLVQGPDTLLCGDKVTLIVDYGFSAVPADVKRAGIIRVRSLLASERSGIPDRATSFVAENGGQFTLATAGMKGWETGIPDVDAVLKRYRFDILDSVI